MSKFSDQMNSLEGIAKLLCEFRDSVDAVGCRVGLNNQVYLVDVTRPLSGLQFNFIAEFVSVRPEVMDALFATGEHYYFPYSSWFSNQQYDGWDLCSNPQFAAEWAKRVQAAEEG